MLSVTEENYLKNILLLSRVEDEVAVNEISHALDLKMPTVNSMMKRLAQKGYVIAERYKPITLTEKGKKEAMLILRRHRLAETFLVKHMGFKWDEVHDIAEQIEHIQSQPFFDKMDELLRYPQMDPHGELIPNKEGEIKQLNHYTLNEVKEAQKYEFISLADSSDEFLKFLNSKKLKLGQTIEVIKREPYDNSLTVRYNGHTEVFSKKVCSKILVE